MLGRRTPESSRVVDRMGFRRVRALILAALMGMAAAGAVPAAAQPGSVSLASLDRGGAQAVVLASFDAAGSTTLWSAPGSRWDAPPDLERRQVPRGISDTQTDSTDTRQTPPTTNSAPAFPDADSDGTADAVSRTIAENTTSGNLGAAITATDTEGDTLTYSVADTGADAMAFKEDFEFVDATSGQISVKSGAVIDFEAPRTSYTVTYQVTDGKNSLGEPDTTIDDTLTLTVTVTDADDAGTVSFDADPAVGTALSATLTDPDMVTSGTTTWQWQRSKRPDTGFTDIASATTASYTPAQDEHAYFLRTTATYTDGDGAGKTAVGVTAHAVGVPRQRLVRNTATTNGTVTSQEPNTIIYKLFGTGDNPAGYQLDRIQVRLGHNGNDPVTAQLYKRPQGTGGVGSFFVDLVPEDPSTDLNSAGSHWLVPPAGTVLEPRTNYFIRMTGVTIFVGATQMVPENPGGASGWHISANSVVHHADDSFRTGNVQPLLIIVDGVELLGPPGPPLGVSGAAGASEVTLSWLEPGSLGQRAVTKYQVRHKKTSDAGFGAWSDVADSNSDSDLGDERSATISSLEGGVEYTLQVRAVNSEGDGTEAETRAAPTSAPSFSAADYPSDTVSRTVTENATSGDLGMEITATDADGDTPTYSVAATTDTDGGGHLDAFNRDFSLDSGTGQISVKSDAMIDYEMLDAYTVLYQVTDGKDSSNNPEATPTIDDTLTLTINVTNVDEPGSVTFGADPAVGTALTATLTDPDMVASGTTTWQWQRSKRPDTGFTDISTAASYTPVQGDHAYFLRATANYTDGEGPSKTATATTRLPVGVTRRTLVKNTGQPEPSGSRTIMDTHLGFVTGDNPAGYVLTRVGLRMDLSASPESASIVEYNGGSVGGDVVFFVDAAGQFQQEHRGLGHVA